MVFGIDFDYQLLDKNGCFILELIHRFEQTMQ